MFLSTNEKLKTKSCSLTGVRVYRSPSYYNSLSEPLELGVEVELTLTSSSLSSLEVLLTSTTTSFLGSTRTKLRHWKVRCPAATSYNKESLQLKTCSFLLFVSHKIYVKYDLVFFVLY